MRLTVGPHSAAVYWRRRALVAGTMLAVVLLLVYSCTGDSDDKDDKKNVKGVNATTTASPTASGPPGNPPPSLIAPSPGEPTTAAVPANQTPNAGSSTCADSEMLVTALAETPTVRQGLPVKLYLRIKNISARTCTRDVGASQQELFLQQNGVKHWSSDQCDARTGDGVVTFPPNHEVEYQVTWNGQATAQGCSNRQFVQKGTYQLYGRLGAKLSEPVTIAITA